MGTDCKYFSIVIISFIIFILLPALGALLIAQFLKRDCDREVKFFKDDQP